MNATHSPDGLLAARVRHGRTLPHRPSASAAIAYEPERYARDPRPDLEGDSPWWGRLLWVAYHRDGGNQAGLFQALHGLRACGARLRDDHGRLRIDGSPISDYDALRPHYLVPHADTLRALLAEVQPWP